MIKTVFIVGPTASGKTALSIEIAKKFVDQIKCNIFAIRQNRVNCIYFFENQHVAPILRQKNEEILQLKTYRQCYNQRKQSLEGSKKDV